SGGGTFIAISAGGFDAGYTCGVNTSGTAYCWGEGGHGELGNGSNGSSLVPVAASGGLKFSAVDAGWRYHTCGLTTTGAAYCWGFNVWGQLRSATRARRRRRGDRSRTRRRDRPHAAADRERERRGRPRACGPSRDLDEQRPHAGHGLVDRPRDRPRTIGLGPDHGIERGQE